VAGGGGGKGSHYIWVRRGEVATAAAWGSCPFCVWMPVPQRRGPDSGGVVLRRPLWTSCEFLFYRFAMGIFIFPDKRGRAVRMGLRQVDGRRDIRPTCRP
jgi:hypothetical protein